MNKPTTGQPQESGPGPTWRTYQGKEVTVYALEGSYAVKRAPGEFREAERAVEAFKKLLELPDEHREEAKIDIYLTDPMVALPAGVSVQEASSDGREALAESLGSEAILRVVQPEAPGEPVAWPVTRLLLRRRFGGIGSVTLFLNGIAGVIAARTGAGPTAKEADEAVRVELEAGHTVSIFPRLAPAEAPEPEPDVSAAGDPVATSFVAYLVENYGAKALSRFLSDYDPDRRDQAATATFQRPLGTLEESWLTGLKHRPRRGSAFPVFARQVIPLIRPYARFQVLFMLYMLFGLLYGLMLPKASQYLLDNVIPSKDFDKLLTFIVALFAIYLVNSILSIRRAYMGSWINTHVFMDLQERMFNHLQWLGHNYYGNAKIGDIMTRLSSDLGNVQGAMMAILNSVLFSVLSALGAVLLMFDSSPLLTMIIIPVVPLFTISYLVLRSRLQKASYERQTLAAEAASTVQENLSAHAVVKAFGMEKKAIDTYHSRLMGLFKSSLRLVVIGSLFSTSTDLAVTLGQLLLLGVGGYLVMTGSITIGVLFAFMAYIPHLFMPVAGLAGLGATVETASGSLDRVNELLDEPAAIADKPGAAQLPPVGREIRLEHVTFNYGGDRPILRDIDITIPAGSRVAVVGPSGSGKSTVVNLLLRFWDPEQGRVLFDGHDLRDVTVASVREQVGLVFQDTFVFDTTVRENIGMSKPGATDAEIAAAAKAARLDAYIESLPAGYDTVLGERGVRMSGGQRQRLAIARAVLRDPRVLVLDEATSALDAQTEREILDTLEELERGRTTISITHRLSMAATADVIFVLEGGRLVEHGSHAELVKAGKLYQQLYEEQTGYVTAGTKPRLGIEVERLRSIPLFSRLGSEALGSLARQLMLERFAAGEDVVRQGEPGDKLYVINKGQVEVLVNVGRGERRVNTLNGGDYFGEMALLMGEPRTATVRTNMPTELYSLSRGDFINLLAGEPEVRQGLAETIGGRYDALAKVIEAAGPAAG